MDMMERIKNQELVCRDRPIDMKTCQDEEGYSR